MCNMTLTEQEPSDLPTAKLIINELRRKYRLQTEQIMTWKKAFNIKEQQHYKESRRQTEELNSLTSQLILLESRLKRKQKQIANMLYQRELTIMRQQKFIEALSNRLVDHGIDTVEPVYDFDSFNDSDSAVVLEDIDSDCNSSYIMRRRSGSGGEVTIVRSISDAIETNLKYSSTRRSNCYLRRPDILETVYSVEEDPEPDIAEKRDKFKNRSERIVCEDGDKSASEPVNEDSGDQDKVSPNRSAKQTQVTNYNRVMSNHRSVTKPKDVKYKRINKAKSKSLEELRGRLKVWVEKGNVPAECPRRIQNTT
ncbi:uncharacterized protein LOC119071779 [Bradysia coprophila]|uniref:uncharacterized protein LOC119071779 n=1 Tax=Bradysia coprophila TaxID=38358 RepID=UPI00187DC747|nr:uncharacterized protein LOC119071779 [Bradysia coprophila]XP_037032731.1 uncharacterized protein LOC119071779 [Bradysia coprophila]